MSNTEAPCKFDSIAILEKGAHTRNDQIRVCHGRPGKSESRWMEQNEQFGKESTLFGQSRANRNYG